MKTNKRLRATVLYDAIDYYRTTEYRGKYHTHGHHIRFKNVDTNEVLIWNTIISPTKANPVERYYGKPIIITYEMEGTNSRNEQLITNVRFLPNA